MEVHHHAHTADPDSHRGKKKWTHYLWEFLMLFLAVFCGFLAENQREHFVEHQREKQYMRSMIDDLVADSVMLDANISQRQSRLQMIDSLMLLLNLPNLGGKEDEVYYYARSISPPTNIFSSDGTMQQLKSAGNLRLIRNRDIANKIMAYDKEIRQTYFEMGDEVQIRAEYRQLASKVFNTKIFYQMLQGNKVAMPTAATPLYSNDPGLLNAMIGAIQYLKKVHITQLSRSQNIKELADELILLIRKEYHLN